MESYDIVKILKMAGKTVSTAESCTGGLVAKMITDTPGTSEVFQYGIVSYSNEAKMKLLGVKAETLALHTEVSPETAVEMAQGVMKLSGADIGVSTTGYAGGYINEEGGGNGLVYIAVATSDGHCDVAKIDYPGYTRDNIRQKAALTAFDMIIKGIFCKD